MTTGSDQWAWWREACKGNIGSIREDAPQPGFYRTVRSGNRNGQKQFIPVAFWYDKDDGSLRCLCDGHSVTDLPAQQELWLRCAKSPISKSDYDHKRKVGTWPDEVVLAATSDGSARPNADLSPFQALEQEISDLTEQAEAWLASTVIDDQRKADKARNWQNMLLTANKKAEAMRVEEKRPHDEAAAAVQAKFRPLLDNSVRSAGALKRAYEQFMVAEEKRQREAAARKFEAEKAAAEAERKRIADERAKLMQDDPIAALTSPEPEMPPMPAAPEPVKVAAGGGSGRRAGLRDTYEPEITDWALTLAHYAGHPDVRAAVEKLVKAETRLHKAATKIPGVTIKQGRAAA